MKFLSSLILKIDASSSDIQTIAEDAIDLRNRLGLMIEIVFSKGTILINQTTTVDEIISDFDDL